MDEPKNWRNIGLAYVHEDVLIGLAKSTENSELLDYLVSITKKWYIYVEVIKNSNTSLNTLKRFFQTSVKEFNTEVLVTLAENPKITLKMMEELLKTNCVSVGIVIAKKPNASESILEELSDWGYEKKDFDTNNELSNEDTYWQVRIEVAKNPKTPKRIIEKLSKDKVFQVRQEAQKRL